MPSPLNQHVVGESLSRHHIASRGRADIKFRWASSKFNGPPRFQNRPSIKSYELEIGWVAVGPGDFPQKPHEMKETRLPLAGSNLASQGKARERKGKKREEAKGEVPSRKRIGKRREREGIGEGKPSKGRAKKKQRNKGQA